MSSPGDTFEREVAELASAALLVERQLERGAVAATVHGAVGGSWRTADGPVTQRQVETALAPFLHAAIGLGALSDQPDRRRLTLGDAGAELLLSFGGRWDAELPADCTDRPGSRLTMTWHSCRQALGDPATSNGAHPRPTDRQPCKRKWRSRSRRFTR